eukprot:CAMPEP_0115069096 /NCGR_PEP_ID=MMETSP0227-20121206/12366_1 /TAXON_ID=89957 /ORGANISM="Polarella glacialis, Strain CCMP 1383" /LENGTH=55 /DNA_ID=CAMNT_0002455457 /DNA_START=496 /DNA_END=663 /DNA_ORIENTATION=+
MLANALAAWVRPLPEGSCVEDTSPTKAGTPPASTMRPELTVSATVKFASALAACS